MLNTVVDTFAIIFLNSSEKNLRVKYWIRMATVSIVWSEPLCLSMQSADFNAHPQTGGEKLTYQDNFTEWPRKLSFV